MSYYLLGINCPYQLLILHTEGIEKVLNLPIVGIENILNLVKQGLKKLNEQNILPISNEKTSQLITIIIQILSNHKLL